MGTLYNWCLIKDTSYHIFIIFGLERDAERLKVFCKFLKMVQEEEINATNPVSKKLETMVLEVSTIAKALNKANPSDLTTLINKIIKIVSK